MIVLISSLIFAAFLIAFYVVINVIEARSFLQEVERIRKETAPRDPPRRGLRLVGDVDSND